MKLGKLSELSVAARIAVVDVSLLLGDTVGGSVPVVVLLNVRGSIRLHSTEGRVESVVEFLLIGPTVVVGVDRPHDVRDLRSAQLQAEIPEVGLELPDLDGARPVPIVHLEDKIYLGHELLMVHLDQCFD